MPRPRKCRFIENIPDVTYFKPRGLPMTVLKEAVLPCEGYEALRLVEIEGLDQTQAAERMQVSRQTFGRILAAARKTLAEAVVLGMALKIEGGHYEVSEPDNQDCTRPRRCPRGPASPPATSDKPRKAD